VQLNIHWTVTGTRKLFTKNEGYRHGIVGRSFMFSRNADTVHVAMYDDVLNDSKIRVFAGTGQRVKTRVDGRSCSDLWHLDG